MPPGSLAGTGLLNGVRQGQPLGQQTSPVVEQRRRAAGEDGMPVHRTRHVAVDHGLDHVGVDLEREEGAARLVPDDFPHDQTRRLVVRPGEGHVDPAELVVEILDLVEHQFPLGGAAVMDGLHDEDRRPGAEQV